MRAIVLRALPQTIWPLPRGGFWFPLAPAELEIPFGHETRARQIVGRGEVAMAVGAELPVIAFDSIFPAARSQATALPSPDLWMVPEDCVALLRGLLRSRDHVHLVIAEDAPAPGVEVIYEGVVHLTRLVRRDRAGMVVDVPYRVEFEASMAPYQIARPIPRVDVRNLRRETIRTFAGPRGIVVDEIRQAVRDVVGGVGAGMVAGVVGAVLPGTGVAGAVDAAVGAVYGATVGRNVKDTFGGMFTGDGAVPDPVPRMAFLQLGRDLPHLAGQLFGSDRIRLWRDLAEVNGVDRNGLIRPGPRSPLLRTMLKVEGAFYANGQIRFVTVPARLMPLVKNTRPLDMVVKLREG